MIAMAKCVEYGEHEVDGEISIDLGPISLVIARESPDLVKVFTRANGQESSLGSINVPIGKPVEILPHPPAGGRVKVDHIMIKLSEDISIPPGGSVTFIQYIPIDIAINVGGSFLRLVPVRAKYALYGPPDLGTLCRYSSNIILKDLPDCLKAQIKIQIANTGSEVTQVSRVVLPLKGIGLYLSSTNQPIASSASMKVLNQTYAEVTTESTPSAEADRISKRVVEPKTSTYIMRYGL